MRSTLLAGIAALAVLALEGGRAQAAWLTIDDANPTTMTISAGDFEDGLYVNGTLVQSGLFSSGSITLPDGSYSIHGRWIDLGADPTAPFAIVFGLAGAPSAVTSGLDAALGTDGTYGTISGTVAGFTGGTWFTTAVATHDQGGAVVGFGAAYMGGSFTPESVPVPAGLALFGSGLFGLGLVARRRR